MNIPKYYIYDTALAPEELLGMYPHAATYDTITLFVSGANNPPAVVDIASLGFNHPYNEEGTGLTAAELNAMVDSLLAPEPPPTDAEVWISKAQARHIREVMFKPEIVEEGL
jgi:hypothetical protein